MPESLQLLFLLCALYALECAQWLPLGTVGFFAWLPGQWRRRNPWQLGPSRRNGVLLGTPWPPLLPLLVCEPLPLQLGPCGILVAGEQPRWLPWDKLGQVAIQDRDLLLDDATVVRLCSRRMALLLGRLLREVAELPTAARPGRLRQFLTARWDHQNVRPRLTAFRRVSLPLLISSNLLWLCLFLGIPLLLWTPLTVIWPQLALCGLLAWLACAAVFRLTLPRLRWLERQAWPDGTHRFMAMASPISSMRSLDLLARELCGDLEPLAVSAALLSVDRFGELARHALLDLEDEPVVAIQADPAAAEDAAWLAAEVQTLLVHLIEERGLSAEKLLAPPLPENDRVRLWCPRCRGQYLHGETCHAAGCRERTLVPFSP